MILFIWSYHMIKLGNCCISFPLVSGVSQILYQMLDRKRLWFYIMRICEHCCSAIDSKFFYQGKKTAAIYKLKTKRIAQIIKKIVSYPS